MGQRFNGITAMQLLKDGQNIRRIMWTKDCYVRATNFEGEYTIHAVGTPRFEMDIEVFSNMLIEQMLEDGDQWETYDEPMETV